MPTWNGEVGPLLIEHCGGCHQEGGSGQFSLLSYEEAQARAPAIAQAVVERVMPPWPAISDESCHPQKDSRRLTESQISLIASWVAGGTPRGDGEAPASEQSTSSDFRADATLVADEPYLVQPGEDDYRCFVVDPQITRDAYLTAFHVALDQAEVVHHIQMFTLDSAAEVDWAEAQEALDPDSGFSCFNVTEGTYLDVWAPGDPLRRYPTGVGQKLQAGVKMVYQVHYHPAEIALLDQTKVEFELSPTVAYPARIRSFGNLPLEIPPGQERFESRRLHTIDFSGDVYGSRLHMHTLGVDGGISIRSSSETSCLIHIPRWDFDWQLFYYFDLPFSVHAGDHVELTCSYDTRSKDDVTLWGKSTEDEMCIGYLLVAEEP